MLTFSKAKAIRHNHKVLTEGSLVTVEFGNFREEGFIQEFYDKDSKITIKKIDGTIIKNIALHMICL
jgi:hypothetical protein